MIRGNPEEDFTVLPCIESEIHRTFFLCFFMTSINPGKFSWTLSSPYLKIKDIFPGSLFGFILSIIFISSSGSRLGPHLIPTGLFIPEQYST